MESQSVVDTFMVSLDVAPHGVTSQTPTASQIFGVEADPTLTALDKDAKSVIRRCSEIMNERNKFDRNSAEWEALNSEWRAMIPGCLPFFRTIIARKRSSNEQSLGGRI